MSTRVPLPFPDGEYATPNEGGDAYASADPYATPYDGPPAAGSRLNRQDVLIGAGGLLLGILLFVMLLLPAPYALQLPGPTVDTLGDRVHIQISGAETYPAPNGELLLTTVSVRGGPGSTVSVGEAMTAWIRGDAMVIPVEEAFAPNTVEAELDAYQQQLMTNSQENAAAAALQELGYEVPMELVIASVEANSPAIGLVQTDDIFTALTRHDTGERVDFLNFRSLSDFMLLIPPGTEVTAHLTRGGEDATATFLTAARSEGDTRTGSVLGIYIGANITFPVTVSFDLDNIGGPSAGMMFSLAVVDLMTEGDLAGGEIIAGTGTMSIDGYVGPIGGIQQKLFGAERDGATWFLAPVANCGEVVGNIPDGLSVVAVSELSDAVDAVEAIAAGSGASLPTCEISD